MFRTSRNLVAAFLLISALGACSAAVATTAPTPNPTPTVAVSTSTSSATTSPANAPSGAADTGALGGTVAPGGNFCGLLGPATSRPSA